MRYECITCPDGRIWISFSGEYMGIYRCDDLDSMDVCPECGGSGLADMCDECREALDEGEW
jgi:hypothetical protein